MRKSFYGKLLIVLTVLLFAGTPLIFSAGPATHPNESQSAAPGAEASALVKKMLILDNAFREVVSAVAVGNGERVDKALQTMQEIMEKVQEGVHEGKLRIPKNAHREILFLQMDMELHEDIEELAEAGKNKDREKMLALTKKLLEGCLNCHREFRK